MHKSLSTVQFVLEDEVTEQNVGDVEVHGRSLWDPHKKDEEGRGSSSKEHVQSTGYWGGLQAEGMREDETGS